MISRQQKSNSSEFRLLKVLSNQDYLAVSPSLATLSSRLQTRPSKTSQQPQEPLQLALISPHSILFPREVVQIDSIWYGVVEVGGPEVYLAKDVEANRLKNKVFQQNVIKDSVLYVLKFLVMFRWSEIKQCLSIKNMLIVRDRLHFMLIPRGNKASFGLKRSERSREKESRIFLESFIENEQNIVKEFGLVLDQIFQQSPQYNNYRTVEQSPAIDLIHLMIAKGVSLDYLEDKFREIHQKKTKAPNMLIASRRQYYDSEGNPSSIVQNTKKARSQRVKGEHCEPQFFQGRHSPSNIALNHRRFLSIRKTEKSTSRSKQYKINRRFNSEGPKLTLDQEDSFYSYQRPEQQKWRTLADQRSQQRQRYNSYLSRQNFDLSLKQKIRRQNETAKQGFLRSLEKNSQKSESELMDEEQMRARLTRRLNKMKIGHQQKEQISAKQLYDSIRRTNKVDKSRVIGQDASQQVFGIIVEENIRDKGWDSEVSSFLSNNVELEKVKDSTFRGVEFMVDRAEQIGESLWERKNKQKDKIIAELPLMSELKKKNSEDEEEERFPWNLKVKVDTPQKIIDTIKGYEISVQKSQMFDMSLKTKIENIFTLTGNKSCFTDDIQFARSYNSFIKYIEEMLVKII